MIYDMLIITHPIYYALTSLVDIWSWGSWVGWPAHSFLPWRVARRSTKRRTWKTVSLCWLLQAVSSGTIYIYMSRCQNSLSSLSSRKIGIAIAFHGGPYRHPWFCKKRWKEEEQKRKRKGNEEEKERKRKRKRKRKGMEKERKRKGKGMEEERKRNGRGKEEERKRKERVRNRKQRLSFQKSKEEERKRKGKRKEKEKDKEKEKERKKKRQRKGQKRKGQKNGKGVKGLFVVWGYFLNKWVSLRYR